MTVAEPKVFLSYDHGKATLVDQMARQLMNKGIDVLYDAWDLKQGDDLYKFMEASVNNETVDFVLIISDANYKEKADSRNGSGVSTEAVILSPEVYKSSRESRFIPIATELDENGTAIMPTFTSSKLYIDFTMINKSFDESMDELIRRLYNEPQQRKPKLGKKPNFSKEQPVDLMKLPVLASEIARVRDMNPRHAMHTFRDKFIPEFVSVFENWLDLTELSNGIIVENEKMNNANDIFMETYDIIASESSDFRSSIAISLLSGLLSSTNVRSENNRYSKDAIATLARYVLLLRISSVLLKNEQYDELNDIFEYRYSRDGYKKNFDVFYPSSVMQVINDNQVKTIVKYVESSITKSQFEQLIQVDLLMYYITKGQDGDTWFPLFWGVWRNGNDVFPLMNSLNNTKYAQRVGILFGVKNETDLYQQLRAVTPIENDHTWGWLLDFPLPGRFFTLPNVNK